MPGPTELLSSEQIKSTIKPKNRKYLSSIEIFDQIDSTNSYLLKKAKNKIELGWICFVEAQTHGRGRLERQWFSPPGHNIYCSLLWKFPKQQNISGLSIAVGVMIAQVLKKLGVKAQLKWPNDVLFSGRKLAGILIEAVADKVVIGIGLNVVLPKEANANWIALADIVKQPIERNQLAGLLVNELIEKLLLFQTKGLDFFIKEWKKLDYLYKKTVIVHSPRKKGIGTMRGINASGELLLENPRGELETFCYGETSVRDVMGAFERS